MKTFLLKNFILILSATVIQLHGETKKEIRTQQWRSGLFRVNTTISSGDESIETVCAKTQKANMDFIVFSDQFLVVAQYGLPPFRRVLKVSKDRKSIVSYGIANYLNDLREMSRKFPKLAIIPGADIAPVYYWTGNPLNDTLCTNQFSEQLTVFGSEDPDFYRGLPVIHNEYIEFKPLWILLDISPLLLTLWGIVMLFYKEKALIHKKVIIFRKTLAALATVTGLIWVIDNQPFYSDFGFNQYKNYGTFPFQQVIDYVRQNEKSPTGIIWSAPEAEMHDNIMGVSLVSKPYLKDIEETHGYNGFAGIYGDVSTAHKPGKLWDKLLLEYVKGKRKYRPVVTGESDYHGRKVIDLIQTVINLPGKLTKENAVKAIINGNSYAKCIGRFGTIEIKRIALISKDQSAGPGETLSCRSETQPELAIDLNIKSPLSPITIKKKKIFQAKLKIISDGKLIANKNIDLREGSYNYKIIIKKNNLKLHYVRFYIEAPQCGWLMSNPIFIKTEE